MVFIKLLIAHFLGDFVFQTDKSVLHKKQYKAKSVFLYLHSVLIGLLSYLLLGDWTNYYIPLIISASHLGIDIWKLNQKESKFAFILDQLLHIIILLIIWVGFYSNDFDKLFVFIQELNFNKIYLIAFAYIFAIWPAGYLIGGITKKWQNQIDDEGLDKAGMWIGQLERILIVSFILIAQIQALGFLIAAKSILRFNVKNKEERKLTEYVLIGTMLSFIVAIGIGLATLHLINIV